MINQNGFYVSDSDIADGMRTVEWPGRLELLCKTPVVFYDGGHNPQCVQAIADWFGSERFADRRITVFAGMVNNKEYRTMLKTLSSFADTLGFYRFEHNRAIPEEETEKLCEEFGMTRIADLSEACDAYFTKAGRKDVLLITGSLYLAAEAKQAVE